jgi:hypothetical protein
MHRAWTWAGIVLLSVATGCASSHQPKKRFQVEARKISLETEPAGATVYQISAIDGSRTLLGTTPIKEQTVAVTTGATFKNISPAEMQSIVSQVEMVHVSIEKPGYQTYHGNLPTQRGKTSSQTIKLEPTTQTTAAVTAR